MELRPLTDEGKALRDLLVTIDDDVNFVSGVITNAETDEKIRIVIEYINDERSNGHEPSKSDIVKLSVDLAIASSERIR